MFNKLEDRTREMIEEVLANMEIEGKHTITTEVLAEHLMRTWVLDAPTWLLAHFQTFYQEDVKEVIDEYEIKDVDTSNMTRKDWVKVLTCQAIDLLSECPIVQTQETFNFNKLIFDDDLAYYICKEIYEI
jgi:hypothetical protein